MKVTQSADLACVTDFNELRIGDLITFPNNKAWAHKTFMIVWHTDNFGKRYRDNDRLKMIQLDGTVFRVGGMAAKCDDCTVGGSYTLTRAVFDNSSTRYRPVLWTGHLTLERM